MKRIPIIVLFISISGVAIAEWAPITKSAADTVEYVDTSSIVRSGHSVKMLWLTDLSKPEYVRLRKSNKTYSSKLFYAEYDCEEKEYRILELTLFSGHMGSGERFPGTTDGPWRDLSDGSEVWRTTWKFACGSN